MYIYLKSAVLIPDGLSPHSKTMDTSLEIKENSIKSSSLRQVVERAVGLLKGR